MSLLQKNPPSYFQSNLSRTPLFFLKNTETLFLFHFIFNYNQTPFLLIIMHSREEDLVIQRHAELWHRTEPWRH